MLACAASAAWLWPAALDLPDRPPMSWWRLQPARGRSLSVGIDRVQIREAPDRLS